MEWVGGGMGFGLGREDIWSTRSKRTRKERRKGKDANTHQPNHNHNHGLPHHLNTDFSKPGSQTTK